MAMSVSYPQVVQFSDRIRARTTYETWNKRHLVVETDRSESDVRAMFRKEGFVESVMEYSKPGRLGRGMEKKFRGWQLHFRLFRHGRNIQIDGELEVSAEYFEHLTHGWLPALDICMDMVKRHFGRCWIYHKKYRRYVTRMRKHVLSLGEPKSKTSVAGAVAAVITVAFCLALYAALSKDD